MQHHKFNTSKPLTNNFLKKYYTQTYKLNFYNIEEKNAENVTYLHKNKK